MENGTVGSLEDVLDVLMQHIRTDEACIYTFAKFTFQLIWKLELPGRNVCLDRREMQQTRLVPSPAFFGVFQGSAPQKRRELCSRLG